MVRLVGRRVWRRESRTVALAVRRGDVVARVWRGPSVRAVRCCRPQYTPMCSQARHEPGAAREPPANHHCRQHTLTLAEPGGAGRLLSLPQRAASADRQRQARELLHVARARRRHGASAGQQPVCKGQHALDQRLVSGVGRAGWVVVA
jgi:hypothetical protein